MDRKKYLIHYVIVILFYARVDLIDARHTDVERDVQTCQPGHVPYKIKNNDGFLELRGTRPQCEEITRVQEVCSPTWSAPGVGCTKGSWVGGIKREFTQGETEKCEYRCKCCTHPILSKAVSIKPMPDFFPNSVAEDAAQARASYVDIVTNVLSHDKFDHHRVEITTVMCHSTTTSKPTTQKPDDHHPDCGPSGNCKLENGNNAQYEKQNVPPPKPVAASSADPKAWGLGGPGCFSADTLVDTKYGRKRMDEIRVGDEILSSVSWDGNSVASYQPITQFIHQDPHVLTRYTLITTVSGRSLSLTPNHLLPQFECDQLLDRDHISARDYELLFTQSAKFARRAKSGQCVLVVDFDGKFVGEEISNVTSVVRRGVFSPITASGILVANGVQASCYSSVENHAIQHAFFTFVRRITEICQPYVDYGRQLFSSTRMSMSMEEKEDGQIPTLLKIMLVLSNMVLGSY